MIRTSLASHLFKVWQGTSLNVGWIGRGGGSKLALPLGNKLQDTQEPAEAGVEAVRALLESTDDLLQTTKNTQIDLYRLSFSTIILFNTKFTNLTKPLSSLVCTLNHVNDCHQSRTIVDRPESTSLPQQSSCLTTSCAAI